MKKLTLIALLISIFQVANAQEVETRNKLILGGSMNFVIQSNLDLPLVLLTGTVFPHYRSDDTKSTVFTISPYFGKEINPRLIVGLQASYSIRNYIIYDAHLPDPLNSPVDIENNSSQIGIGVFSRHILNPNNRFNFFIQPYFEYNLLNSKRFAGRFTPYEEKESYFQIGSGMGILYNINDRFRATLTTGGLSYLNGKSERKGTPNKEKAFSSFRTNINLSTIYFGLELRI